MTHRISSLIILALVLATLWPAAGFATSLKIATIAPDGSFWMKEVQKGADEIAERTEGRVKLRVYPGGTMGNDQTVLRKMRIGQLHGGMMTLSSLSSVAPNMQVYGLPLVFRSYDEVDYVRQRMDQLLMKSLEDNGYISFGVIEGGFAYIMSNKPATNLDDVRGQKAWVPEGDVVGEAILQAAGISPVPLPVSDVLTGLQTGLIDTVAGPPVGAVALQWFTRTKYFTDMPILYSYGSIVFSQRAFLKLSEADRAIVREVMSRVSATLDEQTRRDNQNAREALAKQGLEFVTLTDEEKRRWQEVADTATESLDKRGAVPSKSLAELRRHLEEFRASDE